MKLSAYRYRYLFINPGDILARLLSGEKVKKLSPILYDTRKSKRSIEQVVRKFKIRTIVVESDEIKNLSPEMIQELINFRLSGIRIYESGEFYEIVNRRIPIVKMQDNHYLSDHIFSIRMKKRYKVIKRLFDLLVVFLLLPFALVLVILGVVLTFLSSKGDVFFSQSRVGRAGKVFKIYKIRTMVANSGGFTKANDSRITPVGRFLRLTKIDELPQLYNILKGDMSVVGPRPEIPKYVEMSSKDNPYFRLRHMIKPGVSGWAQIHIPKATPEDNLKKLEYDLFYIKHYSWKMDIKVLFETIRIVLTLNSH